MALFNKASRALDKPLLKNFALVGFLCLAVSSAGSTSLREAEASTRPNILFVLTDDQDPDSLARMDKVQSRLVDEGVRFTRSFVTTPTCCPSRATFLRGQYTHNHGTVSDWQNFRSDGRERSTIATWLDSAGYTSGYIGKYMNGYGKEYVTTYVPPRVGQVVGLAGILQRIAEILVSPLRFAELPA